MKIREILQTEIWSKETSRRILAPARKYLVPPKRVVVRVAIALGIIVALAGIALTIEMLWMTNGERRVATEALAEIDALQSYVSSESDDFEARDRQAKERIEEADSIAETIRDKRTSTGLWLYLYLTESDREEAEMETKARAFAQQRNIPWRHDREFDRQRQALKIQERLDIRSEVLKAMQ